MSTVAADPFEIEVSQGEGGDFERPQPDTYTAILVALVDLGTHERTFPNGQKDEVRKLYFVWELTSDYDSKGKPFLIAQDYTWTLTSDKSKLRKMIEGWLDDPLKDGTKEHPVKFSPAQLLGKPCRLVLDDAKAKASGKTFTEILKVKPPRPNEKVPPTEHEPFMFHMSMLGDPKAEPPIPDWVPPLYGRKVVDEIKSSKEYLGLIPF